MIYKLIFKVLLPDYLLKDEKEQLQSVIRIDLVAH